MPWHLLASLCFKWLHSYYHSVIHHSPIIRHLNGFQFFLSMQELKTLYVLVLLLLVIIDDKH